MSNTKVSGWTIWVDEKEKIIAVKERPGAKKVCFRDEETGIKAVTELVEKGYRIG